MFTPKQQRRYRDLVSRAWEAHTLRGNLDERDKAAREDWYRRQLLECIGLYSTSAANRVEHYDLACLHFAQIAGDMNAIAYFAEAAERRMKFLIRERMAALGEREGRPFDWPYARAIYAHMELPLTIDEAPAGLLWKVFQALDTHVRRRHGRPVSHRHQAA